MFEMLQELEIAWIWFVQSIGAWLATPMLLITMVGSEDFFMFVMPVLYWSFDSALGLRVAILLLVSNGLNTALKFVFHSPRPYWISSRIHAYSAESSFGFPSGHSQTAASVWGFIAACVRGRTGKILLFILIFLIGFSRIFLGVHFISDVLGGWLFGALLVWGFLKLERPLKIYLQRQPLKQLLLIALLSSIILGAVIILPAAALDGWQVPQAWEQNALAAAPDTQVTPLNLNGAFTLSGTWLGLMAGAAWLYRRQGWYNADGTPLQRILRYLVGLAGIFIFYFVLGSIFPRDPNLTSYALRFLRYTLVGLWISLLAPLVFQKMGLAAAPQRPNPDQPIL